MTGKKLEMILSSYNLRVVRRSFESITVEGTPEDHERLRADIERERRDALKWKRRAVIAQWFRNAAIIWLIVTLLHQFWNHHV